MKREGIMKISLGLLKFTNSLENLHFSSDLYVVMLQILL